MRAFTVAPWLQKDGAPKRSPSAFFLFVNTKRPVVKAEYPGEIQISVQICRGIHIY